MEIRVEAHGPHVAVVTIDNQPRRNAMTRQMMAELAAQWDALERASYRCIVLTGAGDRAFSSGADMGGDLSADPALAAVVNHALLKHHPYTKPIVAAVNGDCVGGGVELLLSTDIRAAAPHARFGLPEVRWSIYPFGGADHQAHPADRLRPRDGAPADGQARSTPTRRRASASSTASSPPIGSCRGRSRPRS